MLNISTFILKRMMLRKVKRLLLRRKHEGKNYHSITFSYASYAHFTLKIKTGLFMCFLHINHTAIVFCATVSGAPLN